MLCVWYLNLTAKNSEVKCDIRNKLDMGAVISGHNWE